jgi:Circularly permutated YpsA SLOG family
MTESSAIEGLGEFIPILTVMVDYGFAPFLWLVDAPNCAGIGGSLCDGTGWHESCPMSEGLWRKFADWAMEFDRTSFNSDGFDPNGWDWIAFHARGLCLSRWLKEEVGSAYRVVYEKPVEDPNWMLDERQEVLSDGSVALLPSRFQPEPWQGIQKIVSGGQTGVDRAALDFAMAQEVPHGGWAPSGRQAEDGKIPLKYQLSELADGGYRQRNKRNVKDSDGTLIINAGPLEGGSMTTREFAVRLGKPCFVAQTDQGDLQEAAVQISLWIRTHSIRTLNIAGPRESKRPGMYAKTLELLIAIGDTS